MSSMTSIERFLAAMRSEEVDYLPCSIYFNPNLIVDGIYFDLAPGTSARQWAGRWPDGDGTDGFFRFDVDDERMTKTFVPLETISTRNDGYGPGGHPKPEVRDYSLAWEKSEYAM